jgi:hypothetical protein
MTGSVRVPFDTSHNAFSKTCLAEMSRPCRQVDRIARMRVPAIDEVRSISRKLLAVSRGWAVRVDPDDGLVPIAPFAFVCDFEPAALCPSMSAHPSDFSDG